MAKDGKAKRKKIKLPKEIGGVKIPKEVRKEGERLIEAASALLKSQATAAMLGAMANIRFERGPRGERREWGGRDGGGCGVER